MLGNIGILDCFQPLSRQTTDQEYLETTFAGNHELYIELVTSKPSSQPDQ